MSEKQPSPVSERTAQRATALTWARGCVQENGCWPECYEAALDAVLEGDLDEWERSVATVKQYREYTGARLGAAAPAIPEGQEQQ